MKSSKSIERNESVNRGGPALSRRQILRGTGGVAVGLPFLPSLLPREARAAGTAPPRLVIIAQTQGAWYQYLHGTAGDALPNKQTLFTGHEIKYGPISSKVEGGRRVVSHILSADSGLFSERLLGKMNIIRGLDSVTKSGHHNGMYGNIWNGHGEIPSIDQLVGWSPSYYKGIPFKERTITTGMAGWSWDHENPASRSGGVKRVREIPSPSELWDRLFKGFSAPGGAPKPDPMPVDKRKPLVDHLLSAYKSLRESDASLSASDRQRLDAHMEMLGEIERRVNAAPPVVGAGCTVPMRTDKTFAVVERRDRDNGVKPRSIADSIGLHNLYNDIIATAFKCGLSRIATLGISEYADTFSTYTGGWHGLAHEGGRVGNEPTFGNAYQKVFENVILGLARRLDEDEGNGTSYLDNTLLIWTNEHGARSHNPVDRFTVTLGGASGFFKTGLFVDYRSFTPKNFMAKRDGFEYYTGLTLNQFWANVLYAMGIPNSEWDRYRMGMGQGKGYGPTVVLAKDGIGTLTDAMYQPQALSGSGDKLPVLTS